MNKTMTLMVTGLLSVSLINLTSCKQSELPQASHPTLQESSPTEVLQLDKQLDDYTHAFLKQHPQRARGFFSFLRKIVRVVVADAGAAVVGSLGGPATGVIVGATASALTAADDNINVTISSSTTTSTSESAVATLDETTAEADVIGTLHNELLIEVYKEYPNLNELPEAEIERIIKKVFDEKFANDPRLKEEHTNTTGGPVDGNMSIDAPSSGVSPDIADRPSTRLLIDNLKLEDPSALPSPVFGISKPDNLSSTISAFAKIDLDKSKILAKYVRNVSELEGVKDLRDYTRGIQKIIKKSSVSKKAKKELQTFIAVAANSRILWNVEGK